VPRLIRNVGRRKMSAPNFFHLLWVLPLWFAIAGIVCVLSAKAVVKWPTEVRKLRRFCPYVLIAVLVELTVFHFFDPASAADGIFWLPALHYLNLIFGVPAFMLLCFEWCFRAKGRRRVLILIPICFLCVPVILLQKLHATYAGIYHP
jgi:hypothetical protein